MTAAFVEDEDHKQLRELLRSFLKDRAGRDSTRQLMATTDGLDRTLWRDLVALGVLGLDVPPEYGGGGASLTETAIVFKESGRVLLVAPLLSPVLVGSVLMAPGASAVAGNYLPEILSGETIAALASSGRARPWDTSACDVHAAKAGTSWRLSGRASWVIDGPAADVFIVSAQTPQGLSLFLLHATDTGVERSPVPGLDRTRKLASLALDSAVGTPLDVQGDAAHIVSQAYARAIAVLSAEQVAGAEFVLEQAVGYAKIRYQFGRPIGSFQAIKHKCADMLTRLETARAVSEYAVASVGGQDEDAALATSLAKSYCSDAFLANALDNIQVHGGIGYTWEHDAHLYLKRAKASHLMFGDSLAHRSAIGSLIGV